MPHRLLRTFPVSLAVAGVLACAAMHTAAAQSFTASHRADSVFARAKQLVVNGNGAAGRVLVDSMVAATEPDTPAYADALFWRASLSATSADAERDYRKIVVEYPSSSHAGDALLQLAHLESVRGDRPAAITHLERYLIDNPTSAERGRAGLLLVRLAFEANDARRGCIALGRTLAAVPGEDVELRNQLTYYSPRCSGVDTVNAAPVVVAPPTAAVSASAAASASSMAKPPVRAAARDTAQPARETARESTGRYTLQVAAYTSRADADRLTKKLNARKLDARVSAAGKLFRVRIGHYATRAEAAAAAKSLKARKIDTFVTEAGKDDK